MPQEDFVDPSVCPLCRLGAKCLILDKAALGDRLPSTSNNVTCDRCGKFLVTLGAFDEAEKLGRLSDLSGITREWTDLGRKAEVNQENLGSLLALAPKTFLAKRRKFIEAVIRRAPCMNSEAVFDFEKDFPTAYAKTPNELRFVIDSLVRDDLATTNAVLNRGSPRGLVLTAKGWTEADHPDVAPAKRDKAFVAMWYHADIKAAYDAAIGPAIKGTGYTPVRIDLTEHAGGIFDRIVAEIKESRFVVADFSGQSCGVYFEAGFARGLGLDVIWACRDDHLADLHFDMRGFNIIVWKSHEDLRERLDARIRAVVGYGPHRASATASP